MPFDLEQDRGNLYCFSKSDRWELTLVWVRCPFTLQGHLWGRNTSLLVYTHTHRWGGGVLRQQEQSSAPVRQFVLCLVPFLKCAVAAVEDRAKIVRGLNTPPHRAVFAFTPQQLRSEVSTPCTLASVSDSGHRDTCLKLTKLFLT